MILLMLNTGTLGCVVFFKQVLFNMQTQQIMYQIKFIQFINLKRMVNEGKFYVNAFNNVTTGINISFNNEKSNDCMLFNKI